METYGVDIDPVPGDFEQAEPMIHDFDVPEIISLDLEYPDEVAVVKLALQQTSILSNVVLGKTAHRLLARIDNELAG